MNSFWKKKVPAMLLTLVMLASLAPARLAAPSATTNGNCPKSADGIHIWSKGTVTLDPTCVRTGTRTYVCAECKTTYNEDIPATKNHDYKLVSNARGSRSGSASPAGRWTPAEAPPPAAP